MARRRVAPLAGLLLFTLFLFVAWALTPSAAAASPGAGETAMVSTDGECLRLRAGPGLSEERLDCIPDRALVEVQSDEVQSDGYSWRLVDWAGQGGWVADEFLVDPASAPPPSSPSAPSNGEAAIGCASAQTRGGLVGSVGSSGASIVTWGGGSVHGVYLAAVAQGCEPRSVWVTGSDGLVPYLFGAPAFVNAGWNELYPNGAIAGGTPLLLLCDERAAAPSGTAQAIAAAPASGPAPIASGSNAPEVSARAAIVVDEASGAVLYEKRGHEALPPASLTKIATAVLAIQGADLDAWVRIGEDARVPAGSSLMGIEPGDCFRVRDLLYGLMLPSGNDAAAALAAYLGGSQDAFVHQMNTLVELLGLRESHFIDAHGLGGNGHAISAYDLAMLTRYAMTLPTFREIVATPKWVAQGERTLTLWNVNRFLSAYPGADGVKTGFTGEAGRTLVGSASRGGHRVYVVLLDSQDREADAAALLDWAFGTHSWTGDTASAATTIALSSE